MSGCGRARRGTRLADGTLAFTFDGRPYAACRGDSVASALLAQGVRLFGRSVKYRRPRGLLTAGADEPNALLTAGRSPSWVPNIPAPLLAVSEGLELRSQNCWPSPSFDVHALLSLGAKLFGAGFYYKTFMWPSWRVYEPVIRRLAGLGPAPGAAALEPADTEHFDCDVLVAGAGAAGLAAALAASRAGARVALCDREPVFGGELEFETARVDGSDAAHWIVAACEALAARGARLLPDSTLTGGSGGLHVVHRRKPAALSPDLVYRIRARSVVYALGASERPIAFVDNDRPGVMLLGAAERYLAAFGVTQGSRALLFGNHDRLYAAAARMLDRGAGVCAIVDARPQADVRIGAAARERLREGGVRLLAGHVVRAAHGRRAVEAASVASRDAGNGEVRIDCDAVLVSGGWSPVVNPGGGGVCGAAAGIYELGEAVADGWRAGLAAAHAAAGAVDGPPDAAGDPPPRLQAFWRSPASRAEESRQFVDPQNDVTVADLRLSLAEGFVDIEHVKRYTTLGIGTDQGRIGGTIGAAILAELRGVPVAEVGTSRPRPPYLPANLLALCGPRAGLALRPQRLTALHARHEAAGAVFDPAGLWLRPRYYCPNGANAFDAGVAEAARVRREGGVFDASTLGKIEVAGPDAGVLLDYLYLSRPSAIPVGRARYMVNLREDGMVLDDGIVLRLAPDRFLATVSSAHAEHLLSHFELWRDLHAPAHGVALTDVTEAWAVVVAAGPGSRAALGAILGAAWQDTLGRIGHMHFADGRWHGARLRLLRASFSGELAFEVHCDASVAPALWDALCGAGLAPYGLEAVDVLRLEKGYLLGHEMNGQTTPQDLGMQALLDQGNPCLGRALLDRPAFSGPGRPRLVGLRAAEGARFLAGAQLTAAGDASRVVGHVTSTAFSPQLQRWIGLALVARDRASVDTRLRAHDPLRGLDTPVTVTAPVHFDPQGERMRGSPG